MPALNNPEDVAEAFQSAWNSHDMIALGTLFMADATFVNRFGHYVRGVDAIIAMHAAIHETVYRDSTLKNEVLDVTYIGEGVAIVHFWTRLSASEAHPAGPHQVDTLILAVLTKQETGWLICAFENVTLTDPRTGEPVLRENMTT